MLPYLQKFLFIKFLFWANILGAKWKRQRKLLTPAFHFQILEQYIAIFESQSNTLVHYLQKKIGRGSFDMFPYISLCALDIICEAAMGTQVNAQKDADSEYVHSVKQMCNIIWNRSLSPIKSFDSLFVFSRDYWKQRRALKILHGYTNSVIKNRREALFSKTQNKSDNNSDDTGVKRRLAFLDLLLECSIDGEPLSNECIREEVDTFMFEGHDTTTSGISFTLYCLSKYPKIQEKVVEELQNIFADNKIRAPSYSDLQEMKYLEMVIKESMRLYPPVPIIIRNLTRDTKYDNETFIKGVSMTVFLPGLHTQPDVFPNPDVFDPDRFSPEECVRRPTFSYVPFSAGPRNCIGQRFAMLEMKSTISKVLRNFKLLPVLGHTPELLPDVILKSGNGLHMILQERDF